MGFSATLCTEGKLIHIVLHFIVHYFITFQLFFQDSQVLTVKKAGMPGRLKKKSKPDL